MSTIAVQHAPRSSSKKLRATVQLHALSAGHFTLPEKYFIHPASEDARRTVPSLAFLIQHRHPLTGRLTRMVFDLGLRRDVKRYPEEIQRHLETRRPLTTDPDVVKSLALGGLRPDDIDYVIFSHVHWDHIGEPRDFQKSTFVIGHGAWDLFKPKKENNLRGSHSFFEPDILPPDRTIELKSPNHQFAGTVGQDSQTVPGELNFNRPWKTLPQSDLRAMDIFQDGTVFIVDAPGHLPGHVNLLVQTGEGNWTYLAGDACHDRRIIRGEREIGEWLDSEGHICCIHADKKQAAETIKKIRQLEEGGIEVILAHDDEWEADEKNRARFWGRNTITIPSRL